MRMMIDWPSADAVPRPRHVDGKRHVSFTPAPIVAPSSVRAGGPHLHGPLEGPADRDDRGGASHREQLALGIMIGEADGLGRPRGGTPPTLSAQGHGGIFGLRCRTFDRRKQPFRFFTHNLHTPSRAGSLGVQERSAKRRGSREPRLGLQESAARTDTGKVLASRPTTHTAQPDTPGSSTRVTNPSNLLAADTPPPCTRHSPVQQGMCGVRPAARS